MSEKVYFSLKKNPELYINKVICNVTTYKANIKTQMYYSYSCLFVSDILKILTNIERKEKDHLIAMCGNHMASEANYKRSPANK